MTRNTDLLLAGGAVAIVGLISAGIWLKRAKHSTSASSSSTGSLSTMRQIEDGLQSVEREMGIPHDSLLAVMFTESGLKPDARNPSDKSKKAIAVGLIQLTTGANLPGFKTSDDLERVLRMSAKEQFEQVVKPFYARIKSASGASPGKLRMLNFLPAHASQPLDFVLGRRELDANGKLVGDAIYAGNWGFDSGSKGATGGKGYITVGDVYNNTENALVAAKKALASGLKAA